MRPGLAAAPRGRRLGHHSRMAEPTPCLPDDARLPDSAFRELASGESYVPVVPAGASVPEVTVRSVA